MSIGEFNTTSFTSGTRVKHNGSVYWVKSVDFEEKLIGIEKRYDCEIEWKRYENCEIIK